MSTELENLVKMSNYKYLFKVIVLGDGGCGKTALTVRFAQGFFQESYKMTVGVDFSVKLIDVGDTRVKLQIWDTGGQERFSFVRPLYYRGAMGALLVFDVTNRESFDHLPNWIEELEANTEKVPYVLVGNKIDLPRVVSSKEAIEFAKQFNIKYYYETSAKTGEEVGDCFLGLAYEMIGIDLPPEKYPKVMRDLGLVSGAPAAPKPTPPAIQPSVSATPQDSQPQFEAGLEYNFADEYDGFNGLSSSAAKPAQVSKPQPAPVARPSPQPVPVPKPQPTPVARPSPQPVPVPKPQPTPVARPSPQPVPTPKQRVAQIGTPKLTVESRTSRSEGRLKEQESMPRALGLFTTEPLEEAPANVASKEVPTQEMARIANQSTMPAMESGLKPISARTSTSTGFSVRQQVQQPAKAVLKPQQRTQPRQKRGRARQATKDYQFVINFADMLMEKSTASGRQGGGAGGFVPFSSGFTPTAGGESGFKPVKSSSAMNIFLQKPYPIDSKKGKKKKKKKQEKSVPAGAAGGFIVCPTCGARISPKFRFCNKCGSPIR
ncbi:MAG: GTP-binding protein [Promethearchaeota archaeon]